MSAVNELDEGGWSDDSLLNNGQHLQHRGKPTEPDTGVESTRVEQEKHPLEEHMTLMPVELLELVLMKTFIKQFNDVLDYNLHYKTREAIRLEYSSLAAVCYNWWQTMNGWPQSPTKHWFKHTILRIVNYLCRPQFQCSLPISGRVWGVTQCDNKLFVVCYDSNIIYVFGKNNEQLTNIEVGELMYPTDIASCSEAKQLYISGRESFFPQNATLWRVSSDGRQIMNLQPWTCPQTLTLSLTSRRLVMATHANKIVVCDTDRNEQKCITISHTSSIQHAVETSHGTVVVCHGKPDAQVCEVNVGGHVMRVYNDQQQLGNPVYLSLDSDGRVLVADIAKHRVLLLSSRLELERVLLDTQQHRLFYPSRMCYTEETGQLVIAGRECTDASTGRLSDCVQLFTVRL